MAELVNLFRNLNVFGKHSSRSLKIDSFAFTAFCQITPSLMVLGSVIVTARQFFGDPIKCDIGNVRNFLG